LECTKLSPASQCPHWEAKILTTVPTSTLGIRTKEIKLIMNKTSDNWSTPAKVFFILFSVMNIYIFICFLIVLITETQFWLFMPGYSVGVFVLASPVLLFVYGAAYLVYKRSRLFPFQNPILWFNFLWLIFLLGTLVYELVAAKIG